VLYVLALIAVVVGVDVLFFRHHLWARLIVNIGIVLVIAAFYLRVPETSMSAAPAMRLTQLHGEPTSTLAGGHVGGGATHPFHRL